MGFQWAAVVSLLVFYGGYFGKMAGQRRRGIQTDQIGRGKTGATRAIEMTMKAAAIAVPAAEAASIFLNTSRFPPWVRCVGIAAALAGDAVFICSMRTMRDNWRAGVSGTDRTELVTDGIYRISRNPAFLGFDLVYAGILLAFFNWGLFAVSAFAALTLHLQIVHVEEAFLRDTFGDAYARYSGRVNRYLGRKSGGEKI